MTDTHCLTTKTNPIKPPKGPPLFFLGIKTHHWKDLVNSFKILDAVTVKSGRILSSIRATSRTGAVFQTCKKQRRFLINLIARTTHARATTMRGGPKAHTIT
jgi:hypothetical protein